MVLIIIDLENRNSRFLLVEDFLTDLKQEFENEDNKSVKVMKLKRVEQETKIIKRFVQKFRKVIKK